MELIYLIFYPHISYLYLLIQIPFPFHQQTVKNRNKIVMRD